MTSDIKKDIQILAFMYNLQCKKKKNDMQLYTSYEQAKKERKNLWKTQE